MLRSHTLENLLEDLVTAYDATEISDQLNQVAQHLPESDDYKAVVAAILKALKIKTVSAPISAGDRLPATV
jgi:hypothetical protein